MAPSHRNLRLVLGASIASTALHYTDNSVYIADYPQPSWLTSETIMTIWLLFTLIGVAGYLLFRGGQFTSAGVYWLIYSYTGLSSLGHYLYGALDEFSAKQHVLIWADGLTGLAVAYSAVMLLKQGRAAETV